MDKLTGKSREAVEAYARAAAAWAGNHSDSSTRSSPASAAAEGKSSLPAARALSNQANALARLARETLQTTSKDSVNEKLVGGGAGVTVLDGSRPFEPHATTI